MLSFHTDLGTWSGAVMALQSCFNYFTLISVVCITICSLAALAFDVSFCLYCSVFAHLKLYLILLLTGLIDYFYRLYDFDK